MKEHMVQVVVRGKYSRRAVLRTFFIDAVSNDDAYENIRQFHCDGVEILYGYVTSNPHNFVQRV